MSFKSIKIKPFIIPFFLTLFSLILLLATIIYLHKIFTYKESDHGYLTATIEIPNHELLSKIITDSVFEKKFPNALPTAPNSALTENTFSGYLPKISENLTAYQYYAAPFNEKAYKGIIAVAVGPFEIEDKTIFPKIDQLPHQVSLILSPYTKNLQKVIQYARERGHEVFLSIPLESLNFPFIDTGPDTLMINYATKENMEQLDRVLGKATGYVGLVNLDGGRFVSYEVQMRFLLKYFSERGIAFIDASSNLRSLTSSLAEQVGTAHYRLREDGIFIDVIDPNKLNSDLEKLAGFAKYNKIAVAIFNAAPITIETLANWQAEKASDISFAPLSKSFIDQIPPLEKNDVNVPTNETDV